MRREYFSVERCAIGIPGFDNLCNGGLVRNSMNLVLGGPGTGKSTFLLQFLWNGITQYNENGLYLSFEPDLVDVFQDAMVFGWDFSKFEQAGKCKFIRLSPKSNVKDIKDELMALISKYDIKRVSIDTISVLSINLEKESEMREMIFDLTSLLKRLKITVILAGETLEGSAEGFSLISEADTRTRSLKFFSDCLINLYSSGLGGITDRALRITKMRRTNHARGPIPFLISSEGIKIPPPEKV